MVSSNGFGVRVAETRVERSAADRKNDFLELVAPAIHRARQLGLSDDQISLPIISVPGR